MRIAYMDCFSGAAGDMLVAALVDAGADAEHLRSQLARLNVDGYAVDIQKIKKQGFAATKFSVNMTAEQKAHRHLKHIREILNNSGLADSVREKADRIFTRLAEAEADAHGTTVDKVHFHEVGAIDAIVDVVSVCVCLENLGVQRIVCSPIPTGSGTVHCDHGVMPVPAPATAYLLRGAPIASCDEIAELTTPTGAAVLTTLADAFGPPPAMVLEQVGFGAGTREGKTRPNVMRVLIGTAAEPVETDRVAILETSIDDVSGEIVAHAVDRLLAAGARDAYCVPILMKKGRPATCLTVIADAADADRLEDVIFAETGTLGVRRTVATRRKLARECVTVDTRFGPIRVKVGRRGDTDVTAAPEFEDCRQAAEANGVPVRVVLAEAARVFASQ